MLFAKGLLASWARQVLSVLFLIPLTKVSVKTSADSISTKQDYNGTAVLIHSYQFMSIRTCRWPHHLQATRQQTGLFHFVSDLGLKVWSTGWMVVRLADDNLSGLETQRER